MSSPLDWLDAVRFRWKVVASITTLAVLAAIGYLLASTPVYRAEASLIIDMELPDAVKDSAVSLDVRSIMATQADMVRSPRVAGEAAIEAGLDKDGEYLAEWKSQTDRKVPFEEWLKEKMLNSVEVTVGRDTSLLLISAEAATSEEAARIANGFAKAAVSSRYLMQTEPAEVYADWLERQLALAQRDVSQREVALADFVRQTGLAQGGDLANEGAQTAELSVQLAAAEARAAAAREQVFSDEQSRGDVERSDVIQRLRERSAQSASELAELEAVFGPTHPDVQRTRAELGTLQVKLQSEMQSVKEAFSSSRLAAAAAERAATTASESRLRTLAAQQRQRLQQRGENVARYQTLENEFASAQQTYNRLSERLSEMRLQSEMPQTEVQVFDNASPYLFDREPAIGITLALSLLFGAGLGMLAAILLEFIDPRVRGWASIERRLGAHVIGVLPKPAPRRLSGGGPLLIEME